jgi:single-stranded-DNA-specific exonuclease RecJ
LEASSAHTQNTWDVYPRLDSIDPILYTAACDAGITPLQAQLLYNRGLHSVAAMQHFLHPDYNSIHDPLSIIDMQRALHRIQQALNTKEHITVYGDYDADGITSSALLYRALRTLKQPDAILDFHIPHRLRDGCGLNLPALDKLKARGTQLIITTDCASSDIDQVAYANHLGIDVIITDHHQPPALLPAAYAMVNPWRPTGTAGERYLCGVGIAFKLTQALYRAYGRPQDDERALLDLVAIGTIGDIAPLIEDNHTYVRLGLERLNTTQNPGLHALISKTQLQPGHIRERDVAFSIAPRINAAGRMKEASIAFELLTTEDPGQAETLAEELHNLNIQRQQQTEELMYHIREQAKNNPQHAVVLVDGDNWHEGIIGLVAGKLAEEINKPVIVVSNDPQKGLSRGSARSQKGFNIIEALRNFAPHLVRYGGHAQAAGFTIQYERLEELREHLLHWHANGQHATNEQEQPAASTQAAGEQAESITEEATLPDTTYTLIETENSELTSPLTPNKADLVLTETAKISYKTYHELRALAPFGAGNPEPIFKMLNLRRLKTWTSGKNNQNLRLRFSAIPASPDTEVPTPTIQMTSDNHNHRTNTGNTNAASYTGTYIRGASELERIAKATHINLVFRIETFNDSDSEIWLRLLAIEVLA